MRCTAAISLPNRMNGFLIKMTREGVWLFQIFINLTSLITPWNHFLVFQYPVGENLFQSLFYPLQTKFLDTVNTLCGRVPQVFLKQIEKTMKLAFEQKVIRHARPLRRQRRWTATDAVYKRQGEELILQTQWCFFKLEHVQYQELGVVSWRVFCLDDGKDDAELLG